MESLQDIFKRIEQAQQDIANICAKINQKGNQLDDYDIKNILFVSRELQENAVLLSHYKNFEKKISELKHITQNEITSASNLQSFGESNETIQNNNEVKVIPIVEEIKPEIIEPKVESNTIEINPSVPIFDEIKPQSEEKNIEEIAQQLEIEITQTIESLSSKVSTQNPTANKSIFEKFAEDKTNDNSLANKLSKTKLKDLNAGIGLNEKFLITNELFGGNSNLFNQEINHLNNYNSHPEALSYFNNLQQKLNWNVESKAYEKLKELIERRYL